MKVGLPYIQSLYHTDTALIRSVRELRALGFRVFPLYEPAGDGTCSCFRGEGCTSSGKHPRIEGGFRNASCDLNQIESWWRKWPQANIAIASGGDLVVVDIDGPAGEESAAALDLPPTVEATTGHGRHLYYRGVARSRTGIRPKIDIRGTGGYVVAPPSRHASGATYTWIRDPWQYEMAELPAWIHKDKSSSKVKPSVGKAPMSPERRTLGEGERNNSLFQLACHMASIGLHADEIAAALAARNDACCEPPLPHDEVDKIARSAAKRPGVRVADGVLLEHALQPHSAVKVYLAIRAMADHQGRCIASYVMLAERSGVSKSTVIACVEELENKRLIDIKRPPPRKPYKPNLANEYTLLEPQPSSPPKERSDE